MPSVHTPVSRVARAILDAHAGDPAALRDAVVLVPDAHGAASLARALSAASGVALLLPRMTTLRLWASTVELDRAVTPRAAREAVLYAALAGRAALGEADLWAVCGELLALFDELTRHAVTLPQDARDFTRLVEQAYRARQSHALDFEASLVHELWRMMCRDTRELDAEGAYLLRLTRLADTACAPLFVSGGRHWLPAEQRFFERYARRAPVHHLQAVGDSAVMAVLDAAWPGDLAEPLLTRARRLRESTPVSPLAGRVSLHGAPDAEAEARAVDVQVRDWLLEGRQRIAVIALDRLSARRARALLERAQVLARDESGWPMATTSAATVLARWLDIAAGDCGHRDLLDLMKSPFAFHDWPREELQNAVWRLEQYVREASVLSGIGKFIALAEHHNDAEVRQLLARVQRGLSVLTRARKPLATWLQTLLHSLAEIGVIEGWRADSAGSQVIVFIEKIQKELQGNALIVAFAEWRRWLTRQLESASFVESEVASPVVFTHLAATPLRDFDAALVLGCDARHLGASTDAPVFFNQGVRAQLGLPTRRDEARDTEALLAQLISATPRVVLSWQTHAGAEENLLAPPIERLVALHRVVYGEYGDALVEGRLPALLAQSSLRCVDGGPAVSEAAAPAPSANAALIPDAISASGYQALVTCPYRFHVRYLLGLGEADEVEERIDKSGHGRHVHAILTAFHRAHPQAGTLDQAVAHAELEAISEQAYAASMARDPLARGWLMRWKALIPAYLEWQHAREAEGWRWQAGEAQRELMIKTPRARVIKLYGRLDRVDQHAQGASAVLDYKTRTAEALKKTLETPGEDVQLAVYSLLSQGAAAQYVTLDRDAVQTVALPGDAGEAGAAARERLARLVDALHDGHALPAQGAPNACEYCEMHGLCRRGHWSSPA